MSCAYCKVPDDDNTGRKLTPYLHIDRECQDINVYVGKDDHTGDRIFQIDSKHVDIRVKINFCPCCGEKF
jgi:hypothetical protein